MPPPLITAPACRNIFKLSDSEVVGGDLESSFLRLKFSGAVSSGAESTSKSDSGELGGPVRDGDDNAKGIAYDEHFKRGLLGDDSEPVS